jgi:hypothetical protein
MAIKKANEDKIRKVCSEADNSSGIYVFWREDTNMIKHAYVGQARDLLKRLGEHLSGYKQHIDLSIKKYKLYDEETNPTGYHVDIVEKCDETQLDDREKHWIKWYADNAYQMKNVSLGGQGSSNNGDLNERKPAKGYREGLINGRKKAIKEVAKFFEKNLVYRMTEPITKQKQNALKKFESMLAEVDESESEDG